MRRRVGQIDGPAELASTRRQWICVDADPGDGHAARSAASITKPQDTAIATDLSTWSQLVRKTRSTSCQQIAFGRQAVARNAHVGTSSKACVGLPFGSQGRSRGRRKIRFTVVRAIVCAAGSSSASRIRV